ncbi:MAG TPA: hypothetical protein VHU91_06700 [Mycobacteriales bacterium]|jgi:hypothetical protein|nr:hypothetical protein [Mycobacteriales bacterium]
MTEDTTKPGSDETVMLGIYLNDHAALSRAGVELANRIAHSHRTCSDGAKFRWLADDLAEDRRELLDIMGTLGVELKRYKDYAAWISEKIGRLKPNGSLLRRSPVSTVLEFEALLLSVHGKAVLWRTLRVLARPDGPLDAERIHKLAQRAGEQTQLLERLRVTAVERIFEVPGSVSIVGESPDAQ